MDINDEDLFKSAFSDDQPEIATEEPAAEETAAEPEAVTSDDRQRDELGRFAPKAKESEQQPSAEPQAEADEGQQAKGLVPSGRLREEREAREAAERRANQLTEQMTQLLRQMQQQQPKAEAPPKPDIFENPDGFVRANVSEAITPLQQMMTQFVETQSRTYAIDKYGEEKVTEAFEALKQASNSGDPEAVLAAQKAKASMTPFQDIVKWHEKQTVLRQVGSDPDAFARKRAEELLAKDPEFRAALAAKLNPPQQSSQSQVFKLPPRLGSVSSAQSSTGEPAPASDADFFRDAYG